MSPLKLFQTTLCRAFFGRSRLGTWYPVFRVFFLRFLNHSVFFLLVSVPISCFLTVLTFDIPAYLTCSVWNLWPHTHIVFQKVPPNFCKFKNGFWTKNSEWPPVQWGFFGWTYEVVSMTTCSCVTRPPRRRAFKDQWRGRQVSSSWANLGDAAGLHRYSVEAEASWKTTVLWCQKRFGD